MNKIRLLENIKVMLMTLLVLMSTSSIFAQMQVIKGNVLSDTDNAGIIGATIRVKGSSNGTISDVNGNFSLSVGDTCSLLVSFIGYLPQTVKVDGKRSFYKIILEDNAKNLDEVVVIGYGTQKKKEVTGAVVQLSSELLTRSSSNDLGAAIQGQIAGVDVQSSSGRPGEGSNIQIRGLNTVMGKNEPLFVVDGIPYESNPMLSTNEIENIDVLKDAASAAIYGTRGAGGVILITTKKGKSGTMKVSANSYYGTQDIKSYLPLMNTEQYLYEYFTAAQNVNPAQNMSNTMSKLEQAKSGFNNNTNMVQALLKDNAPIQNHSVTISGGKDELTFNLTANYFNQEGVIINSSSDRFNLRANTEYKKGPWKINTGLGFILDNKQKEADGILLSAYSYLPYLSPINVNALTLQNAGNGDANDGSAIVGLFGQIKQTDNSKTGGFNGNFQAVYSINPYLSYTARVGGSYSDVLGIVVNPIVNVYNNGVLIPPSTRSGVRNTFSRSTSLTIENSLNYNRKFGNHQINLLGLFSTERYTFSYFWAQRYDLLSNDITVLNGAQSDPDAGSGKGYLQDRNNSLVGILGRFQYNYKGRYMLSVSARRDASSRFAPGNRWNTFPSTSIGWNVSDEKFWVPMSDFVNSFKIRASLGTTGNQNFSDYANSPGIVIGKNAIFGAEGSDKLLLGATQIAFANPDVKWETNVQENIGLDLSFLKNSLTLTGDVYYSNKKDMLFPLLLPLSTGAGQNSTVVLNVGDMTNTGIELSTKYRHKGTFSWDIGGTFSKNINLVTKMSDTNKISYFSAGTVATGVTNADRVTVLKEGYEAGAFFMMPTNGIVKNATELTEYQKLVPTAKLGDLRYVDTDHNNILNNDDRVYSGSGIPQFTLGLNLSCNYSNFDLSMQWYGSFGNKVINGTKIMAYMKETSRDLVYQWSTTNPDSPIPANRGADHANYRGYADVWVEDGTFIRLKNIALGYSIPKKVVNSMGVSKLRLYLTCKNVLTLTKYTGFDPEVGNDGLATRGIDKGAYPISAQYCAGVQLDF